LRECLQAEVSKHLQAGMCAQRLERSAAVADETVECFQAGHADYLQVEACSRSYRSAVAADVVVAADTA
jgi:hypothetical protein